MIEFYSCELGNIALVTNDVKQTYKLKDGTYKFDDIDKVAEIIRNIKDPIMLDIGANHGILGYRMIQHIPSIKIIAFEPQKYMYDVMKQSIRENNFNIELHNKCVGKKEQITSIDVYDYDKEGSFGSVSLIKDKSNDVRQSPIDKQKVEMITVDSLNLNQIDFIKIDVEGMELDVLKGGIETIKKFKPVLLVEHAKGNKREIKKFINSFNVGYEITDLRNDLLCVI